MKRRDLLKVGLGAVLFPLSIIKAESNNNFTDCFNRVKEFCDDKPLEMYLLNKNEPAFLGGEMVDGVPVYHIRAFEKINKEIGYLKEINCSLGISKRTGEKYLSVDVTSKDGGMISWPTYTEANAKKKRYDIQQAIKHSKLDNPNKEFICHVIHDYEHNKMGVLCYAV